MAAARSGGKTQLGVLQLELASHFPCNDTRSGTDDHVIISESSMVPKCKVSRATNSEVMVVVTAETRSSQAIADLSALRGRQLAAFMSSGDTM
jgi:hypothetical protein